MNVEQDARTYSSPVTNSPSGQPLTFGEDIMKTITVSLVMLRIITLTVDEGLIPLSMLPKSAEMDIALRAHLDTTNMKLLAGISVK